jgi:hypothetical protein
MLKDIENYVFMANRVSYRAGTTYKSYCGYYLVFPSLQCIANDPFENLLLNSNFSYLLSNGLFELQMKSIFSCEPAVIRICTFKKCKYEKSLFQKCTQSSF